LTLADSPLGRFFESTPNHDYLKLPSIVKLGPGDWRPSNLPLPFAGIITIRKALIWAAVNTFRPHILLVDHMPHGAMGELLPTLQMLKEANSDTRVVLGLRDILDAPEVIRQRWREEGAYDALERYYDMVLVYGEREVFDMAEEYDLPVRGTSVSAGANGSLHYCGYVCTPSTARYAARVRAEQLGNGRFGDKLIVAMAGGGADGYSMMRALLDALPCILAHERVILVLITGPFMPANLRRHLQAHANTAGLPARVRVTVSDSLSYIEAADLVVAMAGYNTTMEILRSRKPAILIPRIGPSAEQRMRASLFAARGWVRMIDPTDLSAERVADSVLDVLAHDSSHQAERRPPLKGLDRAAELLLSLLPASAASTMSETHETLELDIPKRTDDRKPVLTEAKEPGRPLGVSAHTHDVGTRQPRSGHPSPRPLGPQ
jgi:predicted glycosyltransferase